MSRLLNWLDARTGCGAFFRAWLYENIPGGARWRYAWGHALAFMFFVQVVTGLALWAAYSPGRNSAWESVYFIQHEMTAGWLVRGIHHFSSHVMVVLLAIHFLQVVVYGAYRAPREANFWLGLILAVLILGLALTGYWLPADQRALASIQVTVGVMDSVPWVGPPLVRLLLGGVEFGHHTLSRAFALHAGLLPALVAVFFSLHYAIHRRHGRKTPDAAGSRNAPPTTYWPDQWLRNIVVCLTGVLVALGLTIGLQREGGTFAGAELGAPADVAADALTARPEPYFLWVYQLLKYLEDYPLVIAGVAVPAAVLLVLVLMPLWGRWRIGHAFNVLFALTVIGGIAALTAASVYDDYNGRTDASQQYLAAAQAARERARRAVELAGSPDRIPPDGALTLVARDPKLQGPSLFRQHCAACHSHFDSTTTPAEASGPLTIVAREPKASNLWRIGSRGWVAGILNPDTVAGPHYFGNTAFKEGTMVDFVNGNIGSELSSLEGDELAAFRRKVDDVVIAVSAEAQLPNPAATSETASETEAMAARIAAGRAAIINDFQCTGCHKFHDEGELGNAPDLTGYASREWLRGIISDPAHERFYRDTNDGMPAFAPAGAGAENRALLSSAELELLVRWLRREWYEPNSR
jgi:ubiquinol-cytochrome c reductase cytochrome b subunit